MSWYEILGLILGSSVISTLVAALVNRPQTAADAKKTHIEGEKMYTDTLEHRIDVLSARQDRYEFRDHVQNAAINCAHKCQIPDDECPVLQFLDKHPIPPITGKIGEA